MAQQALNVRGRTLEPPKLLLLDGFAGPGRYATGEPGSPLIMLDALLSHRARPSLDGVQFIYLFIEHDQRRVNHLQQEVAQLGELPANVTVHIAHGEFETTFGALVDQATDDGKVLVPTFAFIDPFGYSTASMSLTGRLLAFQRCEVLVFLPLTHVHRFVSRDGQDRALTSLFGCEDWRQAIELQGLDRQAFLLGLFERQLAANPNVAHVRSFQLRTQDGNDYRLVFGVGHDKGLDLAKDAMWKVDPVAGTSFAATTDSGQEVLFAPDSLVDTRPLLAQLRATFGLAPFTIDQAERCTRVETPFRIGHLRKRTLQPAERAGTLEVERTGRSGFKEARIRFLA